MTASIRLLFSAGLVLLLLAACSQSAREVAVGRSHRLLEDSARPHWSGQGARPIAMTLWYPAAVNTVETEWSIGPFAFGRGAVDAPWRSEAPQPLILLSHGTGGSAAQLSWLAEALVQAGYVVLAVSHHGNTAAEAQTYPHGFVLPWERAQDLRLALQAVLADAQWGPRIDRARIGAAGFSLGGYTALLLSGARHSGAAHADFCAAEPDSPSCALPPEAGFDFAALEALEAADAHYRASLERAGDDYREPLVRATFLMAPALVPALDPRSLEALDVPMVIILGSRDAQTPLTESLQRLPDRASVEKPAPIEGATHYVFLAPCTLRGRWFAGPLCADGEGVARKEVHALTADRARQFFDKKLGPAESE
jgi:predicted dienelactone hydrolase